MSYFFAAGAPRSPAATLTTRYGRPSAWRISSSIAERVARARRSTRAAVAEDEQLDLVELVDAEHPARVLAGGARLAAEVRREGRVAERQLVRSRISPMWRPARATSDVPVRYSSSLSSGVDVRALGREEAGAVHRLLADEHRRQHRRVAVLHRGVEREAVEREREQRRVADQVAEARAGEPRRALHVEAADLGVLLRLGGRHRLADQRGARLGVLVGRSRREPSRREDSALARAPRLAQPPPRRARARPACSSSLTPRSSSSCSGVGLPLTFVRERSSSTRGTSSRQPLVGGEPARRTPRLRPCARGGAGTRPARRGRRGRRSREGV